MSGGSTTEPLTDLLWYWFIALVSALLGNLIRLPPLLFYLVFGAVVGNLNLVHRGEGIEFFAEFSITIVFFALGFEETVEHFMDGIKRAWGIASIGAFVPFGCGFLCGVIFFPDKDWTVHLAIATAVTATAVSLTMVVLQSTGLATTNASMGIMTSAILDDVGCLILVAIVIPIVKAGVETKSVLAGTLEPLAAGATYIPTPSPTEAEGISIVGIVWVLVKVIIFFIIIVALHLAILPDDVTTGPVSKIPLLRTYGAKHLLSFNRGEQVALIIVTYALGLGMVGVALGFHPAVGAYFAGLILEESYFQLDEKHNTMEVAKHTVGSASFMWLGPVFFCHLGAGIEIEVSLLKTGIPQALGMAAILWVGQFFSATGAARFVPGGYSWYESALIGFGMLGRAELFFVVLNEVRKEKIIDNEIFFPLALTALIMNITLPICISIFKPMFRRHHPEAKDGIEDEPEATEPTAGGPEGEMRTPSDRPASRRPSVEIGPDGEPLPAPKKKVSHIVRRGIGLGGVGIDVVIEPRRRTSNISNRGAQNDNPLAQDHFASPRRTRSALVSRSWRDDGAPI